MSAFREFLLDDLFKFNQIVFDPLVEVYVLSFFLERLLKYPQLAVVSVAPNLNLTGYIFGTRENLQKEEAISSSTKYPSHSHISSLCIDHMYRRLGLGTALIANFHQASELESDLYVDLNVRQNNKAAIELYESLGYVKYLWRRNYYKYGDHGYQMRMPLKSDVYRVCLRGKVVNKICYFGYILINFLMLYLLGLKDFLLGNRNPKIYM